MLKFNLDAILSARGVKKKYAFLSKLGLTYPVARRLADGDTQTLRTNHIEKICLALNCTPNDLLQWTPDGNVASDHPLQALNRPQSVDILKEINQLPLNRLEELKAKLKEMKGTP